MSARQRRAQLRLQKDLQELADRSWELPTVSALPLEDNILEWHCNIVGSGDHEGVTLHLKLLFPDTYPHQPPEVVLMSRVCHPHVFGDHVCLDMLEEGQWSDSQERDAEFTGWSTCYSVFSILMQLQAFLFDLGNNAHRTRRAAERCECFCGHGLHRVYPPLPEPLPPPARPPVLQDPFESEADSTRAPSCEEVSGQVSRVDRFGVHVTTEDGSIGLLRRSDAPRGSWFQVGQQVTCRVKEKDPKLALSMLRSEEELTAAAAGRLPLQATVTGVKPFGVFVDLGGFSGLLHRSETELLPGQPIPWHFGETLAVRLLGPPGPRLALTTKPLYLWPARPQQLSDGEVDIERLRCFHSKETFDEAVLGVGVSLEAEEANGQKRHHLTSIYDVLALGSFQDGVRKGVWKQKFFEFLPLAIDSEHFQRARAAFEDSIAKLASGKVAEKTQSHGKSRDEKEAEYRARLTLEEYRAGGALALQKPAPASLTRPAGAPFVPEMVFEVLPKLMNSQVVLLSSGQLWRCQKALEGYFAYHHLLLHCLRVYPKLRVRLEKLLDAFHTNPEAREKARVHNIGEFLCLVSVSDTCDWDKLGVIILEEVFDRNVLWILKQAPHLGSLSDCGVSQARLRRSFNANRVSLRLLMFQVAFLKLVKPLHYHEPGTPACSAASCALDRKDRCKGIPGPGEAEWLFERCLDILSVEDYNGFLELVGAAPMSDEDLCRWLRRSVLRSVSKGYHNPRIFEALAQKAKASKQPDAGGEDPEDFGLDTRAKESKAEKRARRKAAELARASASRHAAEYQQAVEWARFYSPHGYAPRQCALFLDKEGLGKLLTLLGPDGQLRERLHQALAGYRLLDGTTPAKLEKLKTFPQVLWVGLGCIECGQAVSCELSGRCMPCCHRAAKEPKAARPIKGLTGPEAPQAQFTVFQAVATRPVQFELHFEVPFDGLVANLSGLRSALTEDLMVKERIEGGTVFSRVTRAGKGLWEKSPEQAMFPGSKLIAGWQGVTDCVFRAKVRGFEFVLLQDTVHNVESLDDLERLKMSRTFCRNHMVEVVSLAISLPGIDLAHQDRPARDLLKTSLQTTIAAVAEIGQSPEKYVQVVLANKQGERGPCLVATATVMPPTGTLASAVQSRLSQSETLATKIADRLSTKTASIGAAKLTSVDPNQALEDADARRAAEQRPCRNCRGVLRLRFAAPTRYVERRAQLESLGAEQLVQRVQLCGLEAQATRNGSSPDGRKDTLNLIIKSEGIIR